MKIGALWLKEKDGKKYFSGKIEVPGLDLQFAVFKNEEKNKENQPDYNIVWSSPNQKKNNSTQQNSSDQVQPFSDDDIPF